MTKQVAEGRESRRIKDDDAKDVKAEVKEEKSERQSRTEKQEKTSRGSRAASPVTEEDKTSDVDTPSKTGSRKRPIVYSAPGTPIDSVPNSPASGVVIR